MSISFRPYQTEALDALFAWWRDRQEHCLIVLPTGTGKSLVVAGICQTCHAWDSSVRIMMITHSQELISQNYAELIGLWPDAPAGINSAGLGKRQIRQMTFCSIQSVYTKARDFGHIDIVLVDEAHLIPKKGTTMYRRLINELTAINPDLRVVGLTATPYRLDSGRLDEGEEALFGGVAYDYSIRTAIEEGYLTPVTTKATKTQLDTTGVPTSGGDFKVGELEAAVDIKVANEGAVREVIAAGVDRRSWLFFCAGIDHAQHICDLVNAAGYSCEVISADTDKHDRKRIIADFKAGHLRAIASMNVLCLSEDTEILTSQGFVGIDEMTMGHRLAAWREDGGIEYAPPSLIVRRQLAAGERFVSSGGSRGAPIRVTANHRMVVRSGENRLGAKVVPAEALVGKKGVFIPAFGMAEPDPIQVETPAYAQDEAAHIRVTSFHLRERGFDVPTAKSMAVEQVARLRSMRYVSPAELTVAECALIGFWLGDGTRAGGRVALAQSMAYPDNVAWVDALLAQTGIHHSRHEKAPASKSRNRSIIWTLARGTGGYGQSVERGCFPIEPYLNKEGSPLLRGLNRDQLSALLDGFWRADGNHHTRVHTHTHVVGTQKPLYDLLQEICVTRGISASIRGPLVRRAEHHADQWVFSWGGRENWVVNDFRFEDPAPGERVWCVTSSTSFLICRRKGKVFVTGNTTGFNAPAVDLMAMLRPTKSRGLYTQMVGRGTRNVYASGYDLDTKEGRLAAISSGVKPNCLVLDFARNIETHGPIDIDPDVRRRGNGGPGEAPAKVCPECETYVPAGKMVCDTCGHEWERKPKDVDTRPSSEAILSRDVKPEWLPVSFWLLTRHTKPGGTDSMKVTYECGSGRSATSISEWICFEHTGFARNKAQQWWRKRGGQDPCPETIDEALGRKTELTRPDELLVRKVGKYPQVVAARTVPGMRQGGEVVGRERPRLDDADIPF